MGTEWCSWVSAVAFPLNLRASSSSLNPEPLTTFLCCRVGGLLLFCAFKAELLKWARLNTLGSRSQLDCLFREGLIFHVFKDVAWLPPEQGSEGPI